MRSWWTRVGRWLGRIVVLYLGVVVLLALLESTLMYPAPPRTDGDWAPKWLEFEDVWMTTTAGNRVHGWLVTHPNPKRFLLLCHGNGEHVAYLGEELDFLSSTYQATVLAFDYRGYGKSDGKPFEAGILVDGEAAHLWLADRVGVAPERIVLWGRSLGGAVAVHLASKHGAEAIVLDRTFSSMVDVASHHYSWLPVRALLQNRYPSEERVVRYTGPAMQVHGHEDSVVPFEFGRRLFEAIPSADKRFLESESMTHNSAWPAEFYEEVGRFLDDASERR